MAKVDLSKFGQDQVFVSFNGSGLKLVHGAIHYSDDLVALYPHYFAKEVTTAPVAPVAPAEEILTEQSSEVSVSVEDEVAAIIEDAVAEIEEVKAHSKKK